MAEVDGVLLGDLARSDLRDVDRLNREIRRRTDVVGIFPNRDAIIRLIGAGLAEHDEWAEQRRCLGLDLITRCQAALTVASNPPQEVTTTTTTIPEALSA